MSGDQNQEPHKKEEDSVTQEEKKEPEDVTKKTQEYLDGWKRCLADFDNYKKQQAKFLEELRMYATEDLVRDLIPILDSLELAIKSVPQSESSRDWKQGIVYIQGQLEDVLKSRGLERIRAFGEIFNPELHEAIESIESEKESGTILEEFQPGYLLAGKVVRPARVKVAR